MKRLFLLVILFCLTVAGFGQDVRKKAISEIVAAEAAFQKMALDSGVRAAFAHFAAPDAVVNRNDVLLVGRDAMIGYMKKSTATNVTLLWKPDFADASNDGTLGYTYGKYKFSATDSTGKRIESEGVFHTVWRRQPNGEWRFVWD